MDTLTSWLLVVIVVLATLWAVFAYTVWAERRHDMRCENPGCPEHGDRPEPTDEKVWPERRTP